MWLVDCPLAHLSWSHTPLLSSTNTQSRIWRTLFNKHGYMELKTFRKCWVSIVTQCFLFIMTSLRTQEGGWCLLVLDCCVGARWQLWNYLCFVPLTVISSHRHTTGCTAVCLLPGWEILISSFYKAHFIKSNSRVSRVCIVSHSFTPISSCLWSLTKKYLEYSKCFLFKQALVLVCLTDRPHIKSETIKGVFSNTGIALCVSNLWFLFILWSLQYKDNLWIPKKSGRFFHLIVHG